MTADHLQRFMATVQTLRTEFAASLVSSGDIPDGSTEWWREIETSALVESVREETFNLEVMVNHFALSGTASNSRAADDVTLQAAHVAMLAAMIADQVEHLERQQLANLMPTDGGDLCCE